VSDTQPFTVQVVRSTRRRRTVGAELKGDVLKVALPSWMSAAEEAQWVEKMSASFRRKLSTERIDLPSRSARLAQRHDLPQPDDIRWADDMRTRWGSCTYSTGSIRISTRLAAFPDWVIDYVIVHELCHLRVRGHGPDFWALANRYPKAERAIGYLIATAGDDDGHGVDDG
jgi:predicted metal-dependent hydrolase